MLVKPLWSVDSWTAEDIRLANIRCNKRISAEETVMGLQLAGSDLTPLLYIKVVRPW